MECGAVMFFWFFCYLLDRIYPSEMGFEFHGAGRIYWIFLIWGTSICKSVTHENFESDWIVVIVMSVEIAEIVWSEGSAGGRQ
jgi:hypothetical protein